MRISLKYNWFTPAGSMLKRGEHTVPDEWGDKLPKSATVLDVVEEEPKEAETPNKEKADDKKKGAI